MNEDKLKVFIGSSTKSLPIVEKIERFIVQYGRHKPIAWNTLGLFEPGRFVFESVEKAARKHGAAIFVFGKDDILMDGSNEIFTVRDNVLIEYGYFAGILEKERVLICVDGNPKIASDLHGVNVVKMENEDRARVEIKDFLDRIQPLSDIERVLLDTGNSPLITAPTPPFDKNERVSILIPDMILVLKLTSIVGKHRLIFDFEPNTIGAYGSEIHYGTPAISYFVNHYITTMIPDFKWRITKENYERCKFKAKETAWHNNDFVKFVENDDWQGFEIPGLNKEFKYVFEKRDFAFLLRLGSKNFASAPRTVHVLFGVADHGRQAALGYFLNNLKVIHEKFGSRDYLLFAEVDHMGAPIGEFTDVFDEVFNSKKI